MDQEVNALGAYVAMLQRVISKHILCFVALFMTFGLFSWAMWLGTALALGVAGFFGAVIFLPVLWRTMQKGGENGNE